MHVVERFNSQWLSIPSTCDILRRIGWICLYSDRTLSVPPIPFVQFLWVPSSTLYRSLISLTGAPYVPYGRVPVVSYESPVGRACCGAWRLWYSLNFRPLWTQTSTALRYSDLNPVQTSPKYFPSCANLPSASRSLHLIVQHAFGTSPPGFRQFYIVLLLLSPSLPRRPSALRSLVVPLGPAHTSLHPPPSS